MEEDENEDSITLVYGGREIYTEVNDDPEDISAEINFDKSHPTTHLYLGDDLKETSGHTILEEESWMEMAIYAMPGLVLMPGQTLPLYFYHPRDIAIIKHVLDRDKTFGQIDPSCGEVEVLGRRCRIGTTMEVLAVKEEEGSAMKVKAIGRQRFVMRDHWRDMGGVMIGKIKILPEIHLTDPFEGLYSPFILKSQKSKKMLEFTSSFTQWPCWLYRQYDADELVKEICEELHTWTDTIHLPALSLHSDHKHDYHQMSSDASQLSVVDFSYEVARTLSIDDEMKMQLLRVSSPIQRLRAELCIIKKCACLCCRKCGCEVGRKEDILVMSSEGAMGAYVNPGGYVHEILTMRKVANILLHGPASVQNSWFFEYAWTIGVCKECKQHVGWRFHVADDENTTLQPTRFWGLCRASVSFKFSPTDELFVPTI